MCKKLVTQNDLGIIQCYFLFCERDEIMAGFLMRQSTVAGAEVAGLMCRVRRDTVDATSP